MGFLFCFGLVFGFLVQLAVQEVAEVISFSIFCQGDCLLTCTVFSMISCGWNMLLTRCK
jgi:hypothetical protein